MIFEEDESSPGTDEDGLMDGGLVDIVSLGKGRAYSVLIKVIFSLNFWFRWLHPVLIAPIPTELAWRKSYMFGCEISGRVK